MDKVAAPLVLPKISSDSKKSATTEGRAGGILNQADSLSIRRIKKFHKVQNVIKNVNTFAVRADICQRVVKQTVCTQQVAYEETTIIYVVKSLIESPWI